MGVVDFLRRLFSHAPSYRNALGLGYKARTYNGDFIFSRRYSSCTVNIHQSVEPHNQVLGPWIDFEIEDACIVITCRDDEVIDVRQIDQIREIFDYVYARGPHLFCMNKHMDFNDEKVAASLAALDRILQE